MKININKKSISSSEINATKNFDALAKSFASGTGGSTTPKAPKFNGWLAGGITTLAVAAGIYFTVNVVNNEKPLESEQVQNSIIENTGDNNKPTINPLIASADIPKKVYKINADKGGTITHFTGSEITIPPGAFKDEDGNIITGEVEIQYREFHDQADIFLSGIPMEYDSAGKKSIFESAGMLEIRGFQKGKRLKIVPNKNFRICMHSKNSDPKFNLYSLDEKDGNWDYEGKDSIDNPKEELVEYRNDTINYIDFGDNEKKVEIKAVKMKEVKINEVEIKEVEIKEVKKKLKIVKKEIVKIAKKIPSEPRKANKAKKSFTIDIVQSEYPELVTYSGTIFEVINNSELPKDVYAVTWNDINLKKESNGYQIELIKDERKIEIPVTPVFEGKDHKNAMEIFNKKYGQYTTQLAKKKEDEKKLKVKLETLKKAYEKQRKEFEANVLKQQKALTSQLKKRKYLENGRNQLKRVFNIRKMGYWNCDQGVAFPKEMIVKAIYTDEKTGEELAFTRLDLIEKGRNICFPQRFFLNSQLRFNPKKNNLLWAITIDGKLAFTQKGDFKNIKDEAYSHTFKMKVIDVDGKSSSEIKEMIKM